ncbi:MAG TPA: hypothetical protein DDW52_00045 [Planctomycetaceae bacterium]|nr:hypothetical protein [Planctomycetaceae bacterium]
MPSQIPASGSKDFCQSALRIEVPLVVSLATKKMSIEQVVSIVPGMIVQFDKPYNSPMTVEVEDQPIASGDIVKIGDKFGVRVREILKPSERLIPLDELPKSSNQSAKIDRRK